MFNLTFAICKMFPISLFFIQHRTYILYAMNFIFWVSYSIVYPSRALHNQARQGRGDQARGPLGEGEEAQGAAHVGHPEQRGEQGRGGGDPDPGEEPEHDGGQAEHPGGVDHGEDEGQGGGQGDGGPDHVERPHLRPHGQHTGGQAAHGAPHTDS